MNNSLSLFLKHPATLALFVLLAIVVIFTFKALFLGYTLWPAAGIYDVPPWDSLGLKGAIGFSNHLLFDNIYVFYPWYKIASEILKSGSLPFWNPYGLCGSPLFADSSTGFFYPLNFVFYLFPLWYAFNLHVLLKLLLSGVFTYIYVRSIQISSLGALVAALSFMFCGYMVGWMGHPQTSVALLLPLLLFLTDKLIVKAGKLYFALISLTVGAVFLATHYETSIYILTLAAFYLLFRLFIINRTNLRAWLRPSGFFCLSIVVGVSIASIQLIPSWEYLSASSVLEARINKPGANIFSLETLPQFLNSLKGTIAYLVPDFFGHPVDNNEWTFPLGLDVYLVISGYIGVVPLFFALFAMLFNWKNSHMKFFLGASIGSFLLLHGAPVLDAALSSLPIFSKLKHSRLVLIYCFSMAILSGIGVNFLTESFENSKRKKIYILLGLFLLSSVAIVYYLNYLISDGEFSEIVNRYGLGPYTSKKIWLFFMWSILGLLTIFSYIKNWLSKKIFKAAIVLLIAADLLIFASRFWPTIEKKYVYPTTPAIEFLKKDKDIFRIFGAGNILLGNTSGVYGIQDIRGHDPANLKDYEKFISGKVGDRRFYYQGDLLPSFTNMMNVKYIIVPSGHMMPHNNFKKVFAGEVDIYLDPSYFPRAFTVHRVMEFPTQDEALAHMKGGSFNPEKEVVITGVLEKGLAAKLSSANNKPGAKAQISHYGANQISIDAEMKEAGILVLSDTYFKGWKVYVDGNESKLYRANYTFRGVFLDEGKHVVEFKYQPMSFKIGSFITISSLVFVLALLVYSLRKDNDALTRQKALGEG